MLTSQEREEIKEWIRNKAFGIVQWAETLYSSPLGEEDGSTGFPGTPDEPEYQFESRRIGTFGLRSRPPAGCETIRLAVGGSQANTVLIGSESRAYGPGDLEIGEAALYSIATGAEIRMRVDGSILVTPAPGRSVIVAEGDKGAARLDDKIVVTGAALQTALDARYQTKDPSPATNPLDDVEGKITEASIKVKIG